MKKVLFLAAMCCLMVITFTPNATKAATVGTTTHRVLAVTGSGSQVNTPSSVALDDGIMRTSYQLQPALQPTVTKNVTVAKTGLVTTANVASSSAKDASVVVALVSPNLNAPASYTINKDKATVITRNVQQRAFNFANNDKDSGAGNLVAITNTPSNRGGLSIAV